MSRLRTTLVSGATVASLSIALLATGALSGSPEPAPERTTAPAGQASALDRQQQHLQDNPKDFAGWASLAIAYIARARATGDPSWYAKAEGAVTRSLALDSRTNYLGYAGQAALANARHDFRGAEVAARKGIAVNAYNSTLYGALADALTQLGRYREAEQAVDRMNRLLPGVPAFSRASYAFELRGDVGSAREALLRARKDAVSAGDKAFAELYLGELAMHYGEGATSAQEHFEAGLADAPGDAILLAARAKALATLGRTTEAVEGYRRSVAARPEPQTVLELAQLLESLGDPGAEEQYALFRIQSRLFAASGVALDTELTLFEADHGTPAKALQAAEAGWRSRPFVEMADAYAWALHANGRDREALMWSRKAFASGWSPAPALYHRGMIQLALGDRAAARTDLTRALRLDPGFDALGAPKARAALAQLH